MLRKAENHLKHVITIFCPNFAKLLCLLFMYLLYFAKQNSSTKISKRAKVIVDRTNKKTAHCIGLFCFPGVKCPSTFSKAKIFEGECQKSETWSRSNWRTVFACWHS